MTPTRHLARKRPSRLAATAAAAACALACGAAQASFTSATACDNVFNMNCVYQEGPLEAFATNSGPGPYGRTFRAMADASPGALRASVGATSDDAGGQDARATATFQDTVHFNLPVGLAEFQVTLSMELHGDCIGVGYPFSCFAQMGLSAGRGLNGIQLNLLQPGRVTGTLTLRAGNDLPLDSFFDLRCHASFGHCAADYSHTGLVTLSSSTAGVSFYSDSGHNYAPVPEPASAALWLAGLLAGGTAGRRRVNPPLPAAAAAAG